MIIEKFENELNKLRSGFKNLLKAYTICDNQVINKKHTLFLQ